MSRVSRKVKEYKKREREKLVEAPLPSKLKDSDTLFVDGNEVKKLLTHKSALERYLSGLQETKVVVSLDRDKQDWYFTVRGWKLPIDYIQDYAGYRINYVKAKCYSLSEKLGIQP